MVPTVLITGGAGYIGSHVSFYMAQKGYQVIVIDNFLHNQDFYPTWAKVIKSDFADIEVLKNIFSNNKIEAVIHLAGSIEVGQSITNPIGFYKNNVENTIVLLDTMLKHNVKKIVFSSTCAIFGDPQILPINEDHAKNPINPYGRSKLMVEEILKDVNRAYDLQFVSLRYFNAAGALPEHNLGEQHVPETHLIPLLLQSIHTNKPFYVYGTNYPTKDGTCIRDFIHVMDIARAHFLALEHLNNNSPSDCFNLGTGHGFSIKEIINIVEELYKTKINIVYTKARPGDPAILVADPMKANTILKWKSKFSDISLMIRSASAFENRVGKNKFNQEIKLNL